MLKITKQNNSIVVEGVNNYKYPDNAVLSFPLNSIICEVDESDIITFHSASNYDVLFSGNVSEITINGESVTKENVGDKFGAISNAASGGGGGLTPEQEEKLNNAVQIADYNADKAAQSAIDEGQNAAIEGLSGNLEGKQDKINDLDAIREGAGKGATAIQSETDPVWQSEKGNYYTKGETDGMVDEAKASAASAMSVASSAESIASTANSKADEALGKLETKADKADIKVYDSKHPSEVTDENAIILNVVGSSYDLNNADNWRLITVPNAEQIHGYYFGVKVSDITSEEKEIGRLIPEQGEGYVALTVIRNDNTVTFKATRSDSNMGYCNYRLYIHSVNDNISLDIASYNSEQSVLINLADNEYIIALGFEEAYGSGKFLTNGLYASTYGQNTILIKANQKNVDNLIKRVQSYSSDTDSIDFEYTNDNRYSVHFKKINGKSIFNDGNIITGAPNYVVDKELSEIPNGKGVAIDIRPNKVYLDLPNGTPHTVTAEEASKKYGCNFNNRRSIFFAVNGRILVIENIDGYISVTGNDGILTMYNATTNEPTTSVENNNYYIKLIEGASLTNNNNWNPLYYEVGEPIEGLSYVKDSTPHKIALEDNLKTINGQSIIGSGNIEIQGGGITEETDPIWTAEKVNYSTTEEMNIELGKKQDKLTNTTTMEVTYEDGSTETITLYKA